MKIAVTGANGFIGSQLSKELKNYGFQVRKAQRKKDKDVFLIKEFDSKTNWMRLLEGVDVLVHCASITHQQAKRNNEKLFWRVNVHAFQRLIDQSVEAKVKKIIYLSSVKVNGNKSSKNIKIKSNTQSYPEDLYGVTKLEAENILKKSALDNNFDFVIIRPPLVYGPGVKANFYNLINLISTGFPLPLAGIRNLRSFVFIGNLVSFIIECIVNQNANGKILLIADSVPLSTPQLIKLISENLNFKSRLFFFPKFILFPLFELIGKKKELEKLFSSLVIDSEEAPKILQWKHPYTTNQGIKKTIKWYKKIKNK